MSQNKHKSEVSIITLELRNIEEIVLKSEKMTKVGELYLRKLRGNKEVLDVGQLFYWEKSTIPARSQPLLEHM